MTCKNKTTLRMPTAKAVDAVAIAAKHIQADQRLHSVARGPDLANAPTEPFTPLSKLTDLEQELLNTLREVRDLAYSLPIGVTEHVHAAIFKATGGTP